MCAYFLGKDASANLDDLLLGAGENKAQCLERCKEQLALDPGFDYNGCVDGCGGMSIRPGETQGEPNVGVGATSIPGPAPFTPKITPLPNIPALPPFFPSIGPGVDVVPDAPPDDVVPDVPPGDEVAPGVPTPAPEPSWIDNLIASIFGKEFETVRGLGERTRESAFDVMAREGLLGTGTSRDVAGDIAWQTERGISDLMRDMEQLKYTREQESLNMLLQYLFSQMGAWR